MLVRVPLQADRSLVCIRGGGRVHPYPDRRVFLDWLTKGLTRVAALSPRASLGRRTVCGRTEQLSAAGFEALRN